MFKHGLELGKEVIPSPQGVGSSGDGLFAKGVSLSQDRPFSHVKECEGNSFSISVIQLFIDDKVKLDGVYPWDMLRLVLLWR